MHCPGDGVVGHREVEGAVGVEVSRDHGAGVGAGAIGGRGAECPVALAQKDVQGVAVSSYQGGHLEYFKYMLDLLRAQGAERIQVFGGGGGVIVPAEIKELQDCGVARIYSPEDGQRMGLQGMINDMLARCDFNPAQDAPKELKPGDLRSLAQVITALELGAFPNKKSLEEK